MFAEQLLGVGVMAILGLLGGLLYDSFRALRQIGAWKKWGTFFGDVSYSLILVGLFILALQAVNDGQLRSYVYLGLILGYSVYFGCLHRFFWRPLRGIMGFICAFLGRIWRLVSWPGRMIWQGGRKFCALIRQKWRNRCPNLAEGEEES